MIVNSVTTRLTDLLVGEVKAQLIAGRIDRVRALLEAAETSDFEPRRWAMAFRPLRPLFRTEAAELEPLVAARRSAVQRLRPLPGATPDAPRHMGGARQQRLTRAWTRSATRAWSTACESLTPLESYAAVDNLKTLYGAAMGLASADSLKQRIAAAVRRLNGFQHYACHFCRSREMDLQRSVVTTGKRESHRSYGFNSTTVHYAIKANIIPPQCSTLHSFCWDCSSTIRKALGVALAIALVYLVRVKVFGADPELGGFLVFGAAARWYCGCQGYWPAGLRRCWRLHVASDGTGVPPRRSRIKKWSLRGTS